MTLEVVVQMPSQAEADAEIVVAQFAGLAERREYQDRVSMVDESGLGWERYLAAYTYGIRSGMFARERIAPRYNQHLRLWTAGAERYDTGTGYSEAVDFIEWHGTYLATRFTTAQCGFESVDAAYPSLKLRRQTRRFKRKADDIAADLDDLLVELRS